MKLFRTKPSNKKPQKKERQPNRWLLNAYIYLLIFINGLIVLISFGAVITAGNPKYASLHLNASIYGFAAVLAIANIFFLTNLLQMRRWGFWGYALCSLFSIVLNIFFGTEIPKALLGLGGPIILFFLLYMGGRRSAWKQMEKSNA